MPTETGTDNMENQSAPIEDMFSEDKYKLEEGLNALNNRPLNPLEEVQQRLSQQYNQQQENLTGSVENVSPDNGEAMAESATVEATQEVAIEKVSAEANQISPDFGAGVKAELQETAKESFKMKIESKVYDLLTSIEKKVGQSIAMKAVKDQFAWDRYVSKDWLAGKMGSEISIEEQHKVGREYRSDVALGQRNLKYGIENVEFVPSGEVIPSSKGVVAGDIRPDRPVVDWNFRSRNEKTRASSSVGMGVIGAESYIGGNPVIGTLEKWRNTLRERREDITGAKQLISNYGSVR